MAEKPHPALPPFDPRLYAQQDAAWPEMEWPGGTWDDEVAAGAKAFRKDELEESKRLRQIRLRESTALIDRYDP